MLEGRCTFSSAQFCRDRDKLLGVVNVAGPSIELENRPEDALRLRNCPACDYDLTGLAAKGICPECGRAYDDQAIYLRGWPTQPTGGRRASWIGWIAMWWMGSVCVTFGAWHREARIAAWALLIGVPVLLAAWRWRLARVRPGPLRVRFCLAGCTQYTLVAEELTTLWRWGSYALIGGLIGWAAWSRDPGIIAIAVGQLIAVCFIWGDLRRARRRRRLAESAGDRLDAAERLAPPVPWSEVGLVEVHSGRKGLAQIWCASRVEPMRLRLRLRRDFVCAVVELPSEAISVLRGRIARWRQADGVDDEAA